MSGNRCAARRRRRAASSTASVVCIRYDDPCPGRRTSTALGLGGVLHQPDPSGRLAERALGLVVAVVADRAARCRRGRRTGAPRCAPSRPAGRSRRSTSARAARPRRGRPAPRRARRTPRWCRRAPRRARRRTPRPAAADRRRRARCARSAGARTPGAGSAAAPARRCRSPARRRRRTTAARPAAPAAGRPGRPSARSAGPIRRSTRSAFTPAAPCASRRTGVYAVSTMTRTTATGRSRVGSARTTADDSMSTASAPVAASRSRSSAPPTMWSRADHRPGVHPQALLAQLGHQRRGSRAARCGRVVAHLAGHDDVAGPQLRARAPPPTPATTTALRRELGQPGSQPAPASGPCRTARPARRAPARPAPRTRVRSAVHDQQSGHRRAPPPSRRA